MEAMTTQTEPVVLFEVTDGVGWITFNWPEAYNALDRELAMQLLEALIRCDEDEGVRAVVVTGKGPSFCSGRRHQAMHAGVFLKTLTVSLHEAIATIARMSKPVITAVNGAAAGARFSLAIAGDLVLPADDARFTVAYTAIGLAPDGSSTFMLPRLIGAKRAFELRYTNRALSASEAKELGIVNQVFPATQFTDQVR
jgi:2-(1,2-epoxy-1,2-dihydrophenyl)acetyl-CoA isomerase